MKKILSLALALILTLSAFVLPASAAVLSEETVEPCVVVTQCPNCSNRVVYSGEHTELIWAGTDSSCTNAGPSHWHYKYRVYDLYECVACSYTYTSTIRTYTVCQG